MITLDNKRIHDLIVEKDKLVNEGRKISQAIDDMEKVIERSEAKQKSVTSKVEIPKELREKGDKMAIELSKILGDQGSYIPARDGLFGKIITEMEKYKLDAIPKELKDSHTELMKKKEELERDRNKLFLKVQKIKDKVTPIIQKEVKPLLNEYDDIETAKTKDGKVIINTFNHLSEFKKKFRK